MKLDKRLAVGSEEVQLAEEDIILELSTGGRALFTFAGDAAIGQIVAFDMGYNLNLRRWFVGIIERLQPAANGHQKAFCRELSGILAKRFSVSIQHATLRQVLAELSRQSGLSILLPDGADYTDRPIPNFTSHGSGYQLLENAGRAFQVPDPIWYQQTDGQLWVGGHADSYWHARALELPAELSSRQSGGDSMALLPVPAIRPGVTISSRRINKVRLHDNQMIITWDTATGSTPEQRRLHSQFPELAAGFHLPKFGRVEAVADRAQAGQLNDPYRPRYAVDVQLLTENGQPDLDVPVYKAVPLPVLFGGPEQGQLQLPNEGTLVELGFAFGRADQPFIRAVLGSGWPLPEIEPGEQLAQQRAEVYQRTDPAGNQIRATDRRQYDSAHQMHRQADDYLGEFGRHHLRTEQHSREEIGASKLIEALGNIELLAAGDIEQASLGNQRHTTGGDLTQLAGRIRRAIAGQLQHLEAPQSWLGSEGENVLILLSELMETVTQLSNTLATHTHPYFWTDGGGASSTSPPNQSGTITGHGGRSASLKGRLDPITEQPE